MTCDYSEVHRDSVPNAFRTQANRNPMPRLTKTRIDKLKPDPSREIFVWCTDPRRFGLRIFPTGRKTFVIQYGRDGRTRRYAIGTFGLPYALKAPTNPSTNAKQSSFATTPSSTAASMPARVRA